MYFDNLLGAARTQKLVKKIFQPFVNLFCSFQSFFSDFTVEINKKHLKMKKKWDFVFSSKLVDMQKLVNSLRELFLSFNHLWVRAALKSWSKYTPSKIRKTVWKKNIFWPSNRVYSTHFLFQMNEWMNEWMKYLLSLVRLLLWLTNNLID